MSFPTSSPLNDVIRTLPTVRNRKTPRTPTRRLVTTHSTPRIARQLPAIDLAEHADGQQEARPEILLVLLTLRLEVRRDLLRVDEEQLAEQGLLLRGSLDADDIPLLCMGLNEAEGVLDRGI